MIENEYTRQEDYYKQQMADLEEEKEQLQVSNVVVLQFWIWKNFFVTLFAHLKLFRYLFVFWQNELMSKAEENRHVSLCLEDAMKETNELKSQVWKYGVKTSFVSCLEFDPNWTSLCRDSVLIQLNNYPHRFPRCNY